MENLASEVSKTLVVADRTHGDIYHVWYGNSETKKIAGVGFTCTEKVRTTPKEWKNAIEWFVSSFGFHHLPIFCFSFETNQNEEGKKNVSISPLRCYLKEGPTYLVPCNKPNAVVSKKTLPWEKLPDTESIRWIWRKEREGQRVGTKPIQFPIYEIETNRTISTLSQRKREEKTSEIREKYKIEEWKQKMAKISEEKEQYRKIGIEKSELLAILEGKERVQNEKERREKVVSDFSKSIDMAEFWRKLNKGAKIYIYGFRYYQNGTATVVYYDKNGNKGIFFDNMGFENFVRSSCFSKFQRLPDKEIPKRKNCPIYYVSPGDEIEFSNFQRFQENQKNKLIRELPSCLVLVDFVEYYRLGDMEEEGEFFAYQYSEKLFRGTKRTILFLETEKEKIPVWGSFLQEEINKIEDIGNVRTPLIVRIGKKKTTKTKHRDRLASIFYETNDLPVSRSIETENIEKEFEKDTPRFEPKTPKETIRKGAEPQKLPRKNPKKIEEYTNMKNFLLFRVERWKITKAAIEKIPSEKERNTKMQEAADKYTKQEAKICETYIEHYTKKKSSMGYFGSRIPSGILW